MTAKRTRMSAEDRREQVLEAATRAFARTGYAGTSTDAVAREAGVSQPYVVRMFGTKLELFLAVFEGATDRIKAAFRAVLDAGPFDPEDDDDWARLGAAYTELLTDRDFLLVMMHGFAAGGDEAIGRLGRRCMGEIFEIVRGTGCTAEQATEFVSQGMLLNVLLAMRAPDHPEDSQALADMAGCAFGEEGLAAVADAS
ncbi:MAG: TetR/AcrR family transcriptional regulator [Nocardioidaceae bacterium]|nr:TetR/AcrR family transcriptional regulator [Nocardioidaceae bacterium]NUS50207.1 TetR/AcrR family transcriptional regulator [Nocardioidaceae bacterium]